MKMLWRVCLLLPLALLTLASPNPAPAPTPAPGLIARQSTGGENSFPLSIPSNCTSQCSVVSAITSCANDAANATCLCSNTIGWELLQCINCGVGLGGVLQQQVQAAQSQLDSFVSGCSSASAPISPLTIGVTATASPSSQTSLTTGLMSANGTVSATAGQAGPTGSATPTGGAGKGRSVPGGLVGLVVGVGVSVWIVAL